MKQFNQFIEVKSKKDPDIKRVEKIINKDISKINKLVKSLGGIRSIFGIIDIKSSDINDLARKGVIKDSGKEHFQELLNDVVEAHDEFHQKLVEFNALLTVISSRL